MAARKVGGPLSIELERDERFHRIYKVSHRVEVDNFTNVGGTQSLALGVPEGPFSVLSVDGLPAPGDAYTFEEINDDWVYCLPNIRVYPDPQQKPGPKRVYIVEQQFTSRAIERRIQQEREHPLEEHDIFSFGTGSFTEEATHDRFGHRIQYSSLEAIRGPQNEWDMGRTSIDVEHVQSTLDLEQVGSFMNCVNDAPIWTAPTRCLKLSRCTIKQLFWKFDTFYKYNYGFDLWIRQDSPEDFASSGWDRTVLDEGTKVLRGDWLNLGTAAVPVWTWVLRGNPNPNNPADFVRFMDTNFNLTRVVLDGAGRPYSPTLGSTTTACAQCPTGAPLVWEASNAWPTDYSSFDGTSLSHSSSCTWQNTLPNPQEVNNGQGTVIVTLEYVIATALWQLSVVGLRDADNFVLPTQYWRTSPSSWNCNATNQMAGSSFNSTAVPTTATVTPATAGQPGAVNIQKYPSANFLDLNLNQSFD